MTPSQPLPTTSPAGLTKVLDFTLLTSDSAGYRKTSDPNVHRVVCEQTGGPCTYLGRDMKTAHAGLTITDAHCKAYMKHFAAAVDAAKVPTKEKAELLEIFAKLKPGIGIK
jgi:hypothetical protein